MTHRHYLHNAVTNGVPSGGAWYDSTVELMTEENVYGNKQWASSYHGDTSGVDMNEIDKSQYPGFAVAPSFQTVTNLWYWLRNISSASIFALAGSGGDSGRITASVVEGVRPAVCIY